MRRPASQNWCRPGGKICRRESHCTRAARHPRSGCASHNDAERIRFKRRKREQSSIVTWSHKRRPPNFWWPKCSELPGMVEVGELCEDRGVPATRKTLSCFGRADDDATRGQGNLGGNSQGMGESNTHPLSLPLCQTGISWEKGKAAGCRVADGFAV